MYLTDLSLALCMKKCNINRLYGFDKGFSSLTDEINEDNAEMVMEEMEKSGLMTLSKEEICINALGQFVINIMSNPDQMLYFVNKCRRVRVYFKNTYYLYIIENKGKKGYLIDFLPDLKHVVGSFIYAMDLDETDQKNTGNGNEESGEDNDFEVFGVSWNENRDPASKIEIYGVIDGKSIDYEILKKKNGLEKREKRKKEDVCSVINEVTEWLFKELPDICGNIENEKRI